MGRGRSIEAEMREVIVRGDLAPASWLRMEELKARFDVGFSPLREALSRLVAEGLVELEPNRGFRVAGLSQADLEDIAVARCAVETAALRRSIERGGHDWEAGVVAALHRYRRKSEVLFAGEEQLRAWEAAHDDIHAALIAACGSPRLIESQKRLQDQHIRYRRLIMIPAVSPATHVGEHEKLVALALDRRADEAVAAVAGHLTITVDALRESRFWERTAVN